MDVLETMGRVLDRTGEVVDNVKPDELGNSTPCTEWNVRQLVNHLVVGNYRFASILRREGPPAPDAILQSSGSLLGAYRDSATAVVEAFR